MYDCFNMSEERCKTKFYDVFEIFRDIVLSYGVVFHQRLDFQGENKQNGIFQTVQCDVL